MGKESSSVVAAKKKERSVDNGKRRVWSVLAGKERAAGADCPDIRIFAKRPCAFPAASAGCP